MRLVAALALACGLWSSGGSAVAEEMSAGPMLNAAAVERDGAEGEPRSFDGFESRRAAATMSFDFTPRNPLSVLFEDAADEPAELRFGIARDPITSDRFAALGGLDGSAVADSPSTLEIGGALHFADWIVGSGYARAPLFGGEADLVSATLGYGPVQARLAYGQTERRQSDTMDVLTFSTDLAAWSWLTLESDLAVGASEDRAEESLAAGRLGIRLNF